MASCGAALDLALWMQASSIIFLVAEPFGIFYLFCFWVYGVVPYFRGKSCSQLGHFSWLAAQTSLD